jgi:hypothetical protein
MVRILHCLMQIIIFSGRTSMHRSIPVAALAVMAAATLAGCATARSYDNELQQSSNSLAGGQVDLALEAHEQINSGPNKDLLYWFEKGEMLRFKNDFAGSRDAWLKADEQIRVWEEDAKTDPEKVLMAIGSVVTNDRAMRYDGYDFEKVLLSSRLALSHIGAGDWNAARTEIKKTHEREAIIADLHTRKYAKVEQEAGKNRKVQTSYKTLKGYPVETLDDPDVVNLRNSYQNAFSHYLAGYVYEALGETGLAAPGYRQAIELRPNTAILEEGLSGLDKRVAAARKAKDADVLFVVESGMAPARKSQQISIPIITHRGAFMTALSFPVIRPDRSVYLPPELTIGSATRVPVTPVASIDAMARRSLRDDMPGIMLRSTVRATTRAVAQAELSNQAGRQFGLAGSLLANIASTATVAALEQADERSWRTLPAYISIARTRLAAGTHSVNLPTAAGWQTVTFNVSGKHTVVPLRLVSNHLYVMQSGGSAMAAAPATMAAPAPATASAALTAAARPAVAPVKPAAVVNASAIPVATGTSASGAANGIAPPARPAPVPAAVSAPAPALAPSPATMQNESACHGGSLAEQFRCAKHGAAKL